MGHNIAHNQYHIPILRGKFARSLGQLFPDIIDEIASSFGDIVSTRPGGSPVAPDILVLFVNTDVCL